MKQLRKVCSAGLSLILALSIIPADGVKAFAENVKTDVSEEQIGYDSVDGIYQNGDISSEDDTYVTLPRYLSDGETVSVEDVIYQGMLEHKESIDISAYHLTQAELKTAYKNVLNSHADVFFVDNSWNLMPNGNYVVSVDPIYNMNKEAADSALEYFYEETDKILSQVKGSWSDLEKALFLQDYLCVNFEYDTSVSVDQENAIYDSYNFLKEKKGVCQAYAITYNYLIQKVGIEGTFATSDSMKHMWNIIKINGNWYHVDVTWDDPTYDMLGRARHLYFLKSDTQMTNSKHHDWTSDVKCTSTTYDTAFWDDVDAPFAYQNGTWYYLDPTAKTINSCSINDEKKIESVYTINSIWYDLTKTGGYYWTGVYSGLGGYDGKLYFNTPDKICSYNLNTKTVETVYSLSDSSSQNLYGIYMNENVVYYGLAASPSEKVSLSGEISVPYHNHSYGEGVVTTNPTCQATGIMTYTCTDCDATKTETVPLIDHNYQKGVCTMCGAECETIFNDETLEADDESHILYGITEKVTIQELEETTNYDIRVLNAAKKEITDENALIGTGTTVQIMDDNNKVIAEYQVCIKGDTSGDGIINVLDMEKIQRSVLKIEILDGVYFEAGLLKKGGTSLTALDMEVVQKHVLGIEKIY